MNIYDIANEAGVSISTVSRVLNKKTNISAKTRKRVEEVLQRNGYTPNAIARGLVTNSLKTVAVVTVDVRVPNYAATIYQIERELTKLDYNVLVCNTGGSLENSIMHLQNLSRYHVDGIIFVGSIFNDICKQSEILGYLRDVPLVLANGQLDLPNSYSVLVDDTVGIALAIKHLYEMGHRDIIYVRDMDTGSAERKADGFINTMLRYGFSEPQKRIYKSTYGIQGGSAVADEILNGNSKVTAIICGEDLTAVGIMKRLQQHGIAVPKDIAVTGYNNSEFSCVCCPELTTVDNSPDVLGRFSVQLLEDLMNGKEALASLMIQPKLVVRESTVAP